MGNMRFTVPQHFGQPTVRVTDELSNLLPTQSLDCGFFEPTKGYTSPVCQQLTIEIPLDPFNPIDRFFIVGMSAISGLGVLLEAQQDLGGGLLQDVTIDSKVFNLNSDAPPSLSWLVRFPLGSSYTKLTLTITVPNQIFEFRQIMIGGGLGHSWEPGPRNNFNWGAQIGIAPRFTRLRTQRSNYQTLSDTTYSHTFTISDLTDAEYRQLMSVFEFTVGGVMLFEQDVDLSQGIGVRETSYLASVSFSPITLEYYQHNAVQADLKQLFGE